MGLKVNSVLQTLPKTGHRTLRVADENVNLNSAPHGEEKLEKAPEHKIGRGIYGQNSYPVTETTDSELWEWRKKIEKIAKEEGLDPFDVIFWVFNPELLMQTAARGGFPVQIRHWKNGMEFYELSTQQRFNLMRIFELVINNDPCHAYLLEGNQLCDQKLVICHVMGHSDFFKNNIYFSKTNRNMLNRIAEHAASVKNILDSQTVTYEEVEQFLEKAYSIENLVDTTRIEPRELKFSVPHMKDVEKLPDNWGVVDVSKFPQHIQKRFNDPERIEEERKAEEKRREEELKQLPREPERDVIGFLIEHSQALKPWQRHILGMIREQSYYFVPQRLTKIMNEGWAKYWDQKLMIHHGIQDLGHTTEIALHNGRGLAMGLQLNPYKIGFEIFKNIEERWNKGRHGPEWEALEEREERRKFDTKEMKGKEKIFEVRRDYKDTDFIRAFLTEEVAKELKLFVWGPEEEETSEDGSALVIKSRDVNEIKRRLIELIENGGEPIIQIVDANFENRGELLLEHVHTYDLKPDYREETLKNLRALWGRPVHLKTMRTTEEGKKERIRISVDDDGDVDETPLDKKEVSTGYPMDPCGGPFIG